ncbi:sperm-associated acrosin inhibitor-like [Saccopteryx leptura]|uniref:sperm-associated acrosin inhibitor-like n=1 Tax=Saccopteryx leptura TaxID=249018 RepID=UPI00339D07BB
MSLFSLLIKVIFFIALEFPLYSDTGYSFSKPKYREPPACDIPNDIYACSREYDPVCATNGRSHYNSCFFCIELMKYKEPFAFEHYGRC